MFTGIIEECGTVERIDRTGGSTRLTVRGPLVSAGAAHGDSISVSGVCLTVVGQARETFTADVMAETLALSTLDAANPGLPVNLERAAAVGGRLGGHIVQGHVDGTGRILAVTPGEAWRTLRIGLPPRLAPLVANKGSIAVDGVSLTVSGISPARDAEPWFEVSLIPETLAATTLGSRTPGDRVNLETDVLARHVQRLMAFTGESAPPSTTRERVPRSES